MPATSLTPSMRGVSKVMEAAWAGMRASIARDSARIADLAQHSTPERVMSLIDQTPLWEAQAALQNELHAELVHSGRRTAGGLRKAGSTPVTPYTFDATRPEAAAWATREAGTLIRGVSTETLAQVRGLVSSAQLGERTWYDISATLRQTIGLDPRRATALARSMDANRAALTAAGVPAGKVEARVASMGAQYAARLTKSRADTIARTEVMRASAEGKWQAYSQGVEDGWISPASVLVWIASEDDLTCEECADLNGTTVPITEGFPVLPGWVHPNCRCDIEERMPDVPDDIASMTDEELAQHLNELMDGPAAAVAGDVPSFDALAQDAPAIMDRSEEMFSPGAHADFVHAALNEAVGYDALPTVVDAVTMDALQAAGRQIVYRGLEGELPGDALRYAEQFRSGDFYAGYGVHGNGTYTAVNVGETATYSRTASTGAVHEYGTTVRMAINADARVVTMDDLSSGWVDWSMSLSGRMAAAETAGDDALLALLVRERDLFSDMGRYATGRGYDAISLPASRDGGVYVVLNRGAVTVQDTPHLWGSANTP
jgi:hypothetical protein